MKGACIVFTLWHKENLLPDDFLGEVIVHMPDLMPMPVGRGIDDMLATIVLLKRPPEPTSGPYVVRFTCTKPMNSLCKIAESVRDIRPNEISSIITSSSVKVPVARKSLLYLYWTLVLEKLQSFRSVQHGYRESLIILLAVLF